MDRFRFDELNDLKTAEPVPTVGGLRYVTFNKRSGQMFAYPYDHKLAWLFPENFCRSGSPAFGCEATVRIVRFVDEHYEYDEFTCTALRERARLSPGQLQDLQEWLFGCEADDDARTTIAEERLVEARNPSDASLLAAVLRRMSSGLLVETSPGLQKLQETIQDLAGYQRGLS